MTDLLVPVVICAVLIALNGLFVAAEFALVGAPRVAIERRAVAGDRVARLVRWVTQDPGRQDRYIATAQLGITFASLGLGMYGEHTLAHALVEAFDALGGARWVAAHALASVLAIVILTYFHIVLGEMVPKALALQRAEQTVLWVARPMEVMRRVLFPLVVVLNSTGNGLLKLVGIDRSAGSSERYHTSGELEYIVRESQEGGALGGEAGDVLRELFEFGALTAADVMVPRVHMVGIPLGASPADLRRTLRSAQHTRYPLYERDLDHIVGVVHAKDLLRVLTEGRPILASDARQVPYVPEAATLDVVVAAMRKESAQMVVVIDEHGGTSGLLTVESLFEEVIGEIEEGRTGADPVSRPTDGVSRVAGTVRLEELGEALGREIRHPEVDSVSGLVLLTLGRPPVVGDRITYQGILFRVTAVAGRGVKECAVAIASPPPAE